MTNPVRCFVAVPLLGTAIQNIITARDRLARSGARVRWVDTEHYHLTLKFLGEIPHAGLTAADRGLRRALGGQPGFSLELHGLGAFPGPEAARVVWVGCRVGQRRLSDLARRVDEELAVEGFAPERRRFSAHLTLGRVREGGVTAELVTGIRTGAQQPFGQVPVTEALLMQSRLTPDGPVYTPLQRYALPLS